MDEGGGTAAASTECDAASRPAVAFSFSKRSSMSVVTWKVPGSVCTSGIVCISCCFARLKGPLASEVYCGDLDVVPSGRGEGDGVWAASATGARSAAGAASASNRTGADTFKGGAIFCHINMGSIIFGSTSMPIML